MEAERMIKFMEGLAKDKLEQASKATSNYVEGVYAGQAIGFNLAAAWMREALDLPLPPDPEDVEGLGLEPEEIQEEEIPPITDKQRASVDCERVHCIPKRRA